MTHQMMYRGMQAVYNTITRKLSRNVHIRTAYEHELPVLREMSVQEGWHVSDQLLSAYHAHDPEGIIIAVDDKDEPLACVAACNLDDDVAFSGLSLTRKDVRGQGLSSKLWAKVENHVGNRNLVSHSNPGAFVQNRRRNMANFIERDIRVYLGFPNPLKLKHVPTNTEQVQLVELSSELFPDLVNYDQGIHLIRREQFLKRFLCADNTTTLLAQKDGNIVGYGCFYNRRNVLTNSIAPLFADDQKIATILLNNLLMRIDPRHLVTFDMPISDNGFPELVESYGFRDIYQTLRISRREHPPVPWDKVFFLTARMASLA